MGKIKIGVGKRVLYHVNNGDATIREGIIEQVSPNGELFKIGGQWYSTQTNLGTRAPANADILDQLSGKPSGQVVIEEPDDPEGKEARKRLREYKFGSDA